MRWNSSRRGARSNHGGAECQFEAVGLERKHWSTTTPIRGVFKEAFSKAGLPYFNPHSFRKTLAQLGQRLCHTPEEFKAWSQNLGHEKVLTTFANYGEIASSRQAEIIRQLRHPNEPDVQMADIFEHLRQFAANQTFNLKR